MPWQKLGRIFDPGAHEWAGSHAQVPTVLVKADRLRIFYSDRHPDNRSFTTYLDVDRQDPSRVLYYHRQAILPYGPPGSFDDEGSMGNYVIRHQDKVYLYYSGWNRGTTVPYRNALGLAVSHDDGDTFERAFDGPIMDRTAHEPYLAVTPSVMKEGDQWRMWYISGLRWIDVHGRYEPAYVVKYAHSKDGINWQRPNITCIPQAHPFEAHSVPSVVKRDGKYLMWFSYRSCVDYRDGTGAFRLGYAESDDGMHWQRNDSQAGIATSDTGWDSTMMCYGNVLEVDGRLLMFYNGNSFSQTGFGYAQWQHVRDARDPKNLQETQAEEIQDAA